MADTPFTPLDGNWRTVSSKANHYADIADAIARSVVTLRAIKDADEGKSDAIAQLKDGAEDVGRDIGKAQERYSLTADALIAYAASLHTAYDDANSAITAINNAQDELDTANQQLTQAENDAYGPQTDPDAAQQKVDDRQDTVDDKVLAVQAAQQLWYDARDAKVRAAEKAEGDIDDVVNGDVGDQLNDSWWDDIGDLRAILEVVCQIAGILAIFLSWVPILGAILVGLAILGALLTLIDASVKLSRGEGSVVDVVFAAVGLVLSVFGGKIFSYLGKLAKFKSLSVLAKSGAHNSKGFKAIAGISKQGVAQELKGLSGLKGMLKNVLKNPFDLKLGNGSTFLQRFADGFKTGLTDFRLNPLKLQDLAGTDFSALNNIAKVTITAINVNTVMGSADKLMSAGTGQDIFMPNLGDILGGAQDLANMGESAIRDAVS